MQRPSIAALLGFDLRKEALVAAASVVGVVVDLARLPVYLASQGADVARVTSALILALGVAVLAGIGR